MDQQEQDSYHVTPKWTESPNQNELPMKTTSTHHNLSGFREEEEEGEEGTNSCSPSQNFEREASFSDWTKFSRDSAQRWRICITSLDPEQAVE